MKPVKQLFDLTGQTALVTGGSRGLGKQIAEGLAEAGAGLFLLARREQWLQPAIDEFRSRGYACDGMLCDVAQPEQAAEAVRRAVSQSGRLDILVNNAGVTWGAPAETMPLEKWRQVLEVNLTGTFLFCQEAGRIMITQGRGTIINLSSINAVQGGLPMQDIAAAGYVASKGGLISLTRELAAKWARHGIRVNAIAPGYFPTRLTSGVWEAATEMLARVPMGRPGGDDELKGVVVFLASEAAGYITGQTLIVDGGTTLV
jgi:gluconate 5-dehydrogenase